MPGSTFLTLTNKVLERINEVQLTSSNFSSASSVQAYAKQAVNDSIREINQKERQWPFNYTSGSQTCTAGTNLYTLPSGYKDVDIDTFFLERAENLGTDNLDLEGRWLRPILYEEWTRYHRRDDEWVSANLSDAGTRIPELVFLTFNDKFGVTPNPTEAFVIKFNYWAAPAELSAHDDTTTIPTRFDRVIVEGAMEKMNLFKDNSELSQLNRRNFEMGIAEMRSQLINKYQHVFVGLGSGYV